MSQLPLPTHPMNRRLLLCAQETLGTTCITRIDNGLWPGPFPAEEGVQGGVGAEEGFIRSITKGLCWSVQFGMCLLFAAAQLRG